MGELSLCQVDILERSVGMQYGVIVFLKLDMVHTKVIGL